MEKWPFIDDCEDRPGYDLAAATLFIAKVDALYPCPAFTDEDKRNLNDYFWRGNTSTVGCDWSARDDMARFVGPAIADRLHAQIESANGQHYWHYGWGLR